MWLLHTNKPDWFIGYIWRYVGDGGFMGIAFVVCYCLLKPKLDVRIAALAFGLAIWLCLVGTILLAPHGTEMLFPLTPITFSLSLLGHMIYGLSIGFLYPVFIRDSVDTRQGSTSSEELIEVSSQLQASKKAGAGKHISLRELVLRDETDETRGRRTSLMLTLLVRTIFYCHRLTWNAFFPNET